MNSNNTKSNNEEDSEIIKLGNVIKNEKRVFILNLFMQYNKLTWTNILDEIENHYNIRINPNTISFHLKYLMDRGYIKKTNKYYVFVEDKRSILLNTRVLNY